MSAPDPELLSLNTATIRERWGLGDIIAGCARHGIRGIAPWRDQVQLLGLKETARRIRDAGLVVTGYCRGGMFPALEGKARLAARDEKSFLDSWHARWYAAEEYYFTHVRPESAFDLVVTNGIDFP